MTGKIYRLIACAIASICLLASCEQPVQLHTGPYIELEVANIGLTTFSVKVEAQEAMPYYIARYTKADFEASQITAESITEGLRKRVEIGSTWAQVLQAGNQEIEYDALRTDTDYKVIAFGLNGAGEITTEAKVIDVHTDVFSAEMSMNHSDAFTYSMDIKPNTDDIGWFAFTFLGTEDRLKTLTDEAIETYMTSRANDLFYYYGTTYDEMTVKGNGTFESECYPDMKVMFTVAAMDRDLRIVSKVQRYMFSPDLDGFVMVDEQQTKNLHTAIYGYNNNELGVLLHVKGFDKDEEEGIIGYAYGFDGESYYYGNYTNPLGIDFFKSSDQVIRETIVGNYQATFEYFRYDPQYSARFDACSTGQEMLELLWKNVSAFYADGRIWDRNAASDISAIYCNGKAPDQVSFALVINKIRNKQYIYNAECCISRCSFKEIGYEIKVNQLPVLAKVEKPQQPRVIDVETGMEPKYTRYSITNAIKR